LWRLGLALRKRRDESECKLRQAESSDGGKTWTRMVPTDIQGYPPHLLKLRDGKLSGGEAGRENRPDGHQVAR